MSQPKSDGPALKSGGTTDANGRGNKICER
jgi:hypothetical protein